MRLDSHKDREGHEDLIAPGREQIRNPKPTLKQISQTEKVKATTKSTKIAQKNFLCSMPYYA